jgi:hypothetical protein
MISIVDEVFRQRLRVPTRERPIGATIERSNVDDASMIRRIVLASRSSGPRRLRAARRDRRPETHR